MNKKALLEYALFARKELETQIALSLNKLGIYKDRITKANVVGDFTIIEGTQETFPKRVYALRNSIVENEFYLKNQKQSPKLYRKEAKLFVLVLTQLIEHVNLS